MNEWNNLKIEQICLKVTDGSHYSPAESNEGYFMASSKDMLENGFDYSDIKTIGKNDYTALVKAGCKPEIGDILIIKDGNSYLKYIFSVRKEEEIVLLSSIAILKPNPKLVDSLFLQFLLRSPNIKEQLKNYVSGAAIPRIVLKDFKQAVLPIPPLPIQQKIAAILSAYDDLIENNLKQIKLLEEMAQITYEEWFVRFKFPNHENTPVDEVTGLPLGWKIEVLENHVELIKDSVLPSDLGNSIRYIGLEHMPRKSIVLSEYGDSDNVGSLKLVVKKGDVLFGKIRPYFHKVGVALDDCITSTDTIVLRARQQELHGIILQTVYSNEFVASAVQSSNGTKMPRANWNVLKNHPIIIPEITVLNQFAEISHNLIFNISNLVNQNQLLKEARDILLPRLMTGKIAV